VAGVLPPVLVPSVLNAELPGPALSPEAGSPAHHEMESLISAASGIVSSGLDMASGRDGRFWGIGTHASASQLKRYESALGQMQQALTKSGGPFLLGAQVTIADLVLMPFIERFDIIGRNFHGVDATEICGGAISSWLVSIAVGADILHPGVCKPCVTSRLFWSAGGYAGEALVPACCGGTTGATARIQAA